MVTAAAIDAGARRVTSSTRWRHCIIVSPGLAGAALLDERVRVSVIADGVHVHPLALELVRRMAGARTALGFDAALRRRRQPENAARDA